LAFDDDRSWIGGSFHRRLAPSLQTEERFGGIAVAPNAAIAAATTQAELVAAINTFISTLADDVGPDGAFSDQNNSVMQMLPNGTVGISGDPNGDFDGWLTIGALFLHVDVWNALGFDMAQVNAKLGDTDPMYVNFQDYINNALP